MTLKFACQSKKRCLCKIYILLNLFKNEIIYFCLISCVLMQKIRDHKNDHKKLHGRVLHKIQGRVA